MYSIVSSKESFQVDSDGVGYQIEVVLMLEKSFVCYLVTLPALFVFKESLHP